MQPERHQQCDHAGEKTRGLDPDAEYNLSWIEGKSRPGTPESASGAWWMRHGIQLELRGDFQAAAFRLDRQH